MFSVPSELNKTVSELTRSLRETTDMYVKHHEENARAANRPAGSSTTSGGGGSSASSSGADGETQSKAVHKLNAQLQEISSQRDKLIKENQRVTLAAKQSGEAN